MLKERLQHLTRSRTRGRAVAWREPGSDPRADLGEPRRDAGGSRRSAWGEDSAAAVVQSSSLHDDAGVGRRRFEILPLVPEPSPTHQPVSTGPGLPQAEQLGGQGHSPTGQQDSCPGTGPAHQRAQNPALPTKG